MTKTTLFAAGMIVASVALAEGSFNAGSNDLPSIAQPLLPKRVLVKPPMWSLGCYYGRVGGPDAFLEIPTAWSPDLQHYNAQVWSRIGDEVCCTVRQVIDPDWDCRRGID